MYECPVSSLKAGEILARPVFGKNGMTFLGEGTVLSDHYIKRLRELGISKVYLLNEVERTEEISGIWKKGGSEATEQLLRELTNPLDSNNFILQADNSGKHERFKSRYKSVVADILTNQNVVELLCKLRRFDPAIFQHSANVATLSGMIGDEFGYVEREMMELTLGSLLFDIGMIHLPPSIISSDKKLTAKERRVLEEHTTNGYRMLSEIKGMPQKSAQVALYHHERFDGSGYPHGKQNGSIPEYAQIAAIADCYDALNSPRKYRGSYRPDDVVEFMFATGNYYFNADLIKIFLRRVAAFPLSSVLTLSNGQTGVVTSYSSSIIHRPVVQIIREADGAQVTNPYELDLAVNKTITVLHTEKNAEASTGIA